MEDETIRVFIDASVLFAACYSSSGASREIIRYALRSHVTVVVSDLVLEETKRNLSEKSQQALVAFEQFTDAVPLEIVEPTKAHILQMQPYTALKDAAVLAAAKAAHVYALVSLDRRHMIDRREEIKENVGLTILLPRELLAFLRQQSRNA